MDKKQLSQLSQITREIQLLKAQINSIYSDVVTDSVKGSYPEFPYTEHLITIYGIDEQKSARIRIRLQSRLRRRLEDLMDTLDEINEYVSTIDDSEIRQIITLRYINNLTWYQIAKHMGVYGDGSTERKKHNRFLKVSPNS